MATREIVVNMVPGGVTPVIHVSQYDDGYGITANLIENSGTYTVPTGATVSIEGTKPDGHGYAYLCTYQDNAVVIPVNTQMTAVKGKHPCELVVRKDGLRVGSKNMIMAVEVAGLGEDTIISDTELPAIIALAQEQEEAAASSASQAAASATEAASSAASAETAKTAAMDAAQDAIDAAQELQTAIQFNAALIHETASGAVASFADGADNVPMKSIVAEITPVQSGSGDPSPTNIRPISGRTGMPLKHGGKNLLNPTSATSRTVSGVTFTKNADGSITASGTATATIWYDIISNNENAGYFPAGSYILHPTYNSNIDIRVAKVGSSVAIASAKQTATPFTLTEGAKLYALMVVTNGTTVNQTFYPMVTPSAISDSTYAPYNATEIPITWESIAGTVYGGTLDVVSGVLTVEYGIFEDDGTANWLNYSAGNGYVIAMPTMKSGNWYNDPKAICNELPKVPGTGTLGVRIGVNNTNIYIVEANSISGVSDAATWKAWLASHPIQIVYPLATPQTYQLTPTEVRTLLGGNTIYTDAGDVSVEYIADTKLYIDKRIAELQALVLEN